MKKLILLGTFLCALLTAQYGFADNVSSSYSYDNNACLLYTSPSPRD